MKTPISYYKVYTISCILHLVLFLSLFSRGAITFLLNPILYLSLNPLQATLGTVTIDSILFPSCCGASTCISYYSHRFNSVDRNWPLCCKSKLISCILSEKLWTFNHATTTLILKISWSPFLLSSHIFQFFFATKLLQTVLHTHFLILVFATICFYPPAPDFLLVINKSYFSESND